MTKRNPLKVPLSKQATTREALSAVTGTVDTAPRRDVPDEPHVPALYRVRPDQYQAIRKEALERAAAKGRGSPDASVVLREIIDAWMEGR